MLGVDRYARAATADTPLRTRRFGERARVSWVVWARVGRQRVRFHTVDVSARGAKLRPGRSLRTGTALELDFIKPDGRRLHVSGVVWRIDPDGVAVMFLGTVPRGFGELGPRVRGPMPGLVESNVLLPKPERGLALQAQRRRR